MINKNLLVFSCSTCRKYFVSEQSLKEHTKQHSGVKCQYCDKIVDDIRKLSWHINRVHVKRHPDFTCQKCRIQFTSKSLLVEHNSSSHTCKFSKDFFVFLIQNNTKFYLKCPFFFEKPFR